MRAQVDADFPVEIVLLDLLECVPFVVGHVVQQHANVAERCGAVGDCRPERRDVGDVALEEGRRIAAIGQLVDQTAGGIGVAADKGDLGALPCESAHEIGADAAASPDDKDDLILQRRIGGEVFHGLVPFEFRGIDSMVTGISDEIHSIRCRARAPVSIAAASRRSMFNS